MNPTTMDSCAQLKPSTESGKPLPKTLIAVKTTIARLSSGTQVAVSSRPGIVSVDHALALPPASLYQGRKPQMNSRTPVTITIAWPRVSLRTSGGQFGAASCTASATSGLSGANVSNAGSSGPNVSYAGSSGPSVSNAGLSAATGSATTGMSESVCSTAGVSAGSSLSGTKAISSGASAPEGSRSAAMSSWSVTAGMSKRVSAGSFAAGASAAGVFAGASASGAPAGPELGACWLSGPSSGSRLGVLI